MKRCTLCQETYERRFPCCPHCGAIGYEFIAREPKKAEIEELDFNRVNYTEKSTFWSELEDYNDELPD